MSLNSFGYGGTNAHLILESCHPTPSGPTSDRASSTNGHTNGNGNLSSNGTSNGSTSPNGDGGHRMHNGDTHPQVSINGSSSIKLVKSDSTLPSPQPSCPSHGHSDNPARSLNGLEQRNLQLAPLLFPVTARSESALASIPNKLHGWLAGRNTTLRTFRDLSYTLSCRRSRFRWRSVVVATDPGDLNVKLATALPKIRAATSHALSFVFTGQGAQWSAMGRELIATSSCFRDSIIQADRSLSQIGCDWSLLEELNKPDSESRVGKGEISQPATTAIQIALVDLLASFDIKPNCVVGHSSGEIAGAYAAGALSLHDAIQA